MRIAVLTGPGLCGNALALLVHGNLKVSFYSEYGRRAKRAPRPKRKTQSRL